MNAVLWALIKSTIVKIIPTTKANMKIVPQPYASISGFFCANDKPIDNIAPKTTIGRKKEKKLPKNPFAICETIAPFAKAFNAKSNNKSEEFFNSRIITFRNLFFLYTNILDNRCNPKIDCLRFHLFWQFLKREVFRI